MKKIFILVVGILLCTAVYAQENKAADQNGPYKVYCEIIGQSHALSNKVDVELDFGQASKFWTGDRSLYDENGKKIKFNSMLDAANYMGRRGWDLEVAYPVVGFSAGSSDSPIYHWVMSKMVTDEAQITEGLRTGDMLKK